MMFTLICQKNTQTNKIQKTKFLLNEFGMIQGLFISMLSFGAQPVFAHIIGIFCINRSTVVVSRHANVLQQNEVST